MICSDCWLTAYGTSVFGGGIGDDRQPQALATGASMTRAVVAARAASAGILMEPPITTPRATSAEAISRSSRVRDATRPGRPRHRCQGLRQVIQVVDAVVVVRGRRGGGGGGQDGGCGPGGCSGGPCDRGADLSR